MNGFQKFQACQVGDVGVALVVTVVDQAGDPVDLTAAIGMKIRLQRPDATVAEFDATLYTDGSDGKMVYATAAANDLDQAGEWGIQGTYTLAGAAKSTTISPFLVRGNIS